MPLSQIVSASIEDGAVAPVDLSSVAQYTGFKNRIINGGMVIDQRNAGASVTITSANVAYVTDRFFGQGSITSKFTGQRSSTAPTGFINSLLFTSSAATTPGASDYYYFGQYIEGLNVADLAWGTASAATVTVSFWVRSSITGTYSGAVLNGSTNRSYAFTYTINSADTFEQKTVTIPGDTSGTWAVDNTTGLMLRLSLGAGSSFLQAAGSWGTGNVVGATGTTQWISTSGATFYATGVQIEKGVTATSFDYRPYTTEFQLCQRYYYKQKAVNTASVFGSGFNNAATNAVLLINFPVTMRTSPVALEQTGTAANYSVYYQGGSAQACSSVPIFNTGDVWSATVLFTVASGLTSGQASMARANNVAAYLAWSAEL